jgi:hypothetical protein
VGFCRRHLSSVESLTVLVLVLRRLLVVWPTLIVPTLAVVPVLVLWLLLLRLSLRGLLLSSLRLAIHLPVQPASKPPYQRHSTIPHTDPNAVQSERGQTNKASHSTVVLQSVETKHGHAPLLVKRLTRKVSLFTQRRVRARRKEA